ncbi:ABC transporter permease [Tengunoibacter tsumagoiensis]|uniref:ABC transporter permease n=1 Tax=Tengunoibacter tsumagoiensis TaxID=2014871 RepID=A0A402A8S3_9CHLR|nr:ABC transporter permease [Tengunoibacter tsumagoiensis]GCE15552.1 ABC transporter permease [Tengunoibacter tsumagoiensis]
MKRGSVLLRKSLADVTRRKGRSMLVILGIFLGVLGLTAVNVANDTFGRQFLSIVAPTDVPNATFTVANLPSSVLTDLPHVANVETVEVRTQIDANWRLADGRSASLELNGYQRWQTTQLNTFHLTSGRWPGPGEVVMASRDRFVQSVTPGDRVSIVRPTGQIVVLRVVGLAYTVEQSPAQAVAYMSAEGLRQLVAGSTPDNKLSPSLTSEILIKMHDQSFNGVEVTYAILTSLLKAAHVTVSGSHRFSTAGQQETQLGITGFLTVLLVLASIALLLVCVMILNTVNMLLTEQMKAIGTMKALGGTRWRIIQGYLVSIGLYALVGTAPGLGLGLLLCSQVTTIVANQAQLDLPPFQIAPWVILVSITVGLLVPVFSALGPLWMGTSIPVCQAMAAYGVSPGKRQHASAWGRRVHWVPQTVWLGVREIFRRPGRATLTLFALTISGAMFLAVQVANESIGTTLFHERNLYIYDMRVGLASNLVVSRQLRSQIQALPDVAQITPSDTRTFVMTSGGELLIDALPTTRQVYQPHVLSGHWLTNQGQPSLVLSDTAAQRLHLQLGEDVTFRLEIPQAQSIRWKIVGIVHELAYASSNASSTVRLGMAFTTLDTFQTLANLPADGPPNIWIFAHDHGPQALQQLRKQVVTIFEQAHVQVNLDTPVLDQAAQLDPTVTVYALLDTVAILVALVGILSLSNTLAASVLERRTEIGILRSLGATGRRIGLVFWIESLVLALIAWCIGVAIGLPGGAVLVEMLNTFAGPFDTIFNPGVVVVTLLFVVAVSIISSVGPALSAARLPIGEMLRYE